MTRISVPGGVLVLLHGGVLAGKQGLCGASIGKFLPTMTSGVQPHDLGLILCIPALDLIEDLA